eukprot:9210523-Ditylum_brightwellii.AAC.1
MAPSDILANEVNNLYTWAQNGFPIKSVDCRKGDKVEITKSSSTFRVLMNNVNGLGPTYEDGDLLEELFILKELK